LKWGNDGWEVGGGRPQMGQRGGGREGCLSEMCVNRVMGKKGKVEGRNVGVGLEESERGYSGYEVRDDAVCVRDEVS